MNNMQIIVNEAIASGFFSKEEIKGLIESGKDIPFHTYAVWKSMGFVPMAGTHGWECRLWRKKKNKKEVDEKEMAEVTDDEQKRDFYLTKSYLFHISQVEKMNLDNETCYRK